MKDEQKTIYIEKPVDRAVIIFQSRRILSAMEWTKERAILEEQVRRGVVLLNGNMECVGWVSPETEVKV